MKVLPRTEHQAPLPSRGRAVRAGRGGEPVGGRGAWVCDRRHFGTSGDQSRSSSSQAHVVQGRQGGRSRVPRSGLPAALQVCHQGFQVSLPQSGRGQLPLQVQPPAGTDFLQSDHGLGHDEALASAASARSVLPRGPKGDVACERARFRGCQRTPPDKDPWGYRSP